MNKVQLQVQEFHREILAGPTSPAEPKVRNAELRAKLILEEAIETVVALVGEQRAFEMGLEMTEVWNMKAGPKQEPNLLDAIDGIGDLIYVCYGTAEDIGVDLEPFLDEIHAANMRKRGGSISDTGKQQKPADWTPPDIAGVLARVIVGRRRCHASTFR